MPFHARQTSAAICCSVAAVFIVLRFWHPARDDAIAGSNSAIDALPMSVLDLIEDRPFDVLTFGPLGENGRDLQKKAQRGQRR